MTRSPNEVVGLFLYISTRVTKGNISVYHTKNFTKMAQDSFRNINPDTVFKILS